MKRTLKFRVWNGAEMEYNVTVGKFGVFYVNPGNKDNGLDENDSASLTPFNTKYSDTIPVMQSTGLLDKTGKEIYEGDIFRVEEQADDRMYYLVVHWIKDWCMFGCLTVGEYTDYLVTGISALDEPMFWTYTLEDTDSRKFFLCGNVYQNANLLEPERLL